MRKSRKNPDEVQYTKNNITEDKLKYGVSKYSDHLFSE